MMVGMTLHFGGHKEIRSMLQGVVVGVDGTPVKALIGSSFIISSGPPIVQLGYGRPGLSTSSAGTFSIDRSELYANRIVAVDDRGNVGLAEVAKDAGTVKIALFKPRAIKLVLENVDHVKDRTCSIEIGANGGSIGYGNGAWGPQALLVPQSDLSITVSNRLCRIASAPISTKGTVTISVSAAAWAKNIGKIAPPISPTSFSGFETPFNRQNFTGKWVLVDFWAVWCQPCLIELDRVSRFYREHRKDLGRFEVLAIHSPDGKDLASLKSSLDSIEKRYWHGKSLPFPLVFDSTGKTHRDWGIEIYPSTLLIDPTGKLVGPASVEDLSNLLKNVESSPRE